MNDFVSKLLCTAEKFEFIQWNLSSISFRKRDKTTGQDEEGQEGIRRGTEGTGQRERWWGQEGSGDGDRRGQESRGGGLPGSAA